MAWTIVETGVAVIDVNVHPRLVRAVSNNNAIVSYWDTPGPTLIANAGHNVFHFTLGAILGGNAYFHATWHQHNCVSHFQCSVDNHGTMTVTAINHQQNQNTHHVPIAWAQNFAQAAYQAVEIKKEETKKLKETARARHKKAYDEGNKRFFLKTLGLGVKPVRMKPTSTTRHPNKTSSSG